MQVNIPGSAQDQIEICHLAIAADFTATVGMNVQLILVDVTQIQRLTTIDHELADGYAADHGLHLFGLWLRDQCIGGNAAIGELHMLYRIGGTGDRDIRLSIGLVEQVDRCIQHQAVTARPAPLLARGQIDQRLDTFQGLGIVEDLVAADHIS